MANEEPSPTKHCKVEESVTEINTEEKQDGVTSTISQHNMLELHDSIHLPGI